jgi:hypothetical protein
MAQFENNLLRREPRSNADNAKASIVKIVGGHPITLNSYLLKNACRVSGGIKKCSDWMSSQP